MKNINQTYLPLGLYPVIPIFVGKLEITRHQFDCLVAFYKLKNCGEAGRILQLSYKGVDSHLRTIKAKISNFGENHDIIRFLDSCSQNVRDLLETHYRYLRIEEAFRHILGKISQRKRISYEIKENNGREKQSPFFHLHRHLQLLNVKKTLL